MITPTQKEMVKRRTVLAIKVRSYARFWDEVARAKPVDISVELQEAGRLLRNARRTLGAIR